MLSTARARELLGIRRRRTEIQQGRGLQGRWRPIREDDCGRLFRAAGGSGECRREVICLVETRGHLV